MRMMRDEKPPPSPVIRDGGGLGMGPAGLEPAAYCLGGSRSIHLSYKP